MHTPSSRLCAAGPTQRANPLARAHDTLATKPLHSYASKTDFPEPPKGEVRRIPIPRTRVNKAKGRGLCSAPALIIAVYLNCKVAILLAASIVYQGSPLGATVMPNGSLFLTTLPSVMTPASVIRAMLPLVDWVNHTEPSEEAAMPSGPTFVSGNSRTLFVSGSSSPTPCGVKRAVNHISSSEATVSWRGVSWVGVTVTAPVAGLSSPIPGASGAVNHTLPPESTATSAGSGTGNCVNCPVATL